MGLGVILIVDDDSDVIEILRTTVELAGWDVIDTDDGTHATDLAAVNQPSVILLDVMMPNMDGFETLKELREDSRTAHIPIIMLSAIGDYEIGASHDEESMGTRAGAVPPDGFLAKPVDPAELMDRITELTA